ncbi:hypothetical protein LTSERUB_4797 [Salmonella enterica subsp. enterica serovar Rubislaw str. A4-653]|uniref:4-deoxy-L-threo-5-hexosulose-uronate ketol-isomerase n=1 Tax=Salmonella enterica subsp. enterica serovar Rubislaw str. A4-653 TaxID=913081 RepID=G5QP67_SALRU|nr:hypothetical protein LTSERUB_4797 [Salmonella enterica subsp. enterica serovar Rubislaw str. A4-653]
MFYLLLKTFIQATMMPLNKSKQCFEMPLNKSKQCKTVF